MRMDRLLVGLSRRSAFTLIELMIVVVIVAILAMVAIPLYQSSVENARMSEGISGVGTVRTALRVYAAGHNGAYPVLAAVDGTGLGEINVQASDLDGKFFAAVDYEVTSAAAAYTITATDPDTGLMYEINQDGTETTGAAYYNSGH